MRCIISRQCCIVHQVRNTLKYIGEKNKKEFAKALKTIYHAPSEDAALEQLKRVTEKWDRVSQCNEKLAQKLGCDLANF